MNDEPSTPLDEQLLPMLLACDQALAAGAIHPDTPDSDPPSELRQRLQGNLACIQLLRQVLPRRAPSERVSAPSALPLRRLGRFEIHRELGHGAFGMVFLATDPQLGREVALKVPRPEGLLTAELRERFVREARAAAGLDHPNVVPVYEAGAEGPICYIASAYCPGITLAEWLANHSEAVPLRQAAMLVATLAGAVQHAHERGVVHRDLKPSNVLLQGKPRDPADANSTVNVPGRDGSADRELAFVPRITDFGLAKLTLDAAGQPGEEGGARTQSGALLGTPNYMAPEQASGKNKEVGPAADVYALGVILYELLTGRPPFVGETVLDTLEQVRSREPLPPHRLRPKLSRDLETICLKCLEKEPRKRYASAAALSDDLHRYLDGAPIQARPIRAWERGVKWARRKPAQAMLVAASIALVVVVLSYNAALAGKNTDLEQSNENLKQTLTDLNEKRQHSIENFRLARMAIDEYATKVSDDKRLVAHDHEELRRDLMQLAINYYQQFIKQRAEDPDVVDQRGEAFLHYAHLANRMGAKEDAVKAAQEAVDIFRQLVREHEDVAVYHFLLSEALNGLSVFHLQSRRVDLAEAGFQESRDIRRRLNLEYPAKPEYVAVLADTLGNLSAVYRESGRYELSEQSDREVLKLREKLAQDYPDFVPYRTRLLSGYFNLGLLFEETSRLELAEEFYGKARELAEGLACEYPNEPDRQNELGTCLTNLGLLYTETNRSEQAVQMFSDVESIYQKLVAEHPKIPNYRDYLAVAYVNMGKANEQLHRPDSAEVAYKKADALFEQLMNDYPDQPDYRFGLSGVKHNLGHLLCSGGRAKEAVALLHTAREIEEKLIQAHPSSLEFRTGLGDTYSSLGDAEHLLGNARAALDWLDRSVQMLEGVLKVEPRQIDALGYLRGAYNSRVERLMEQGRYRDVLRDLNRLLELANGQKNNRWRLQTALALARMKRHGPAITEVEELDRKQPLTTTDLYNLACVCSLCSAAACQDAQLTPFERKERAEQYADRAIKLLKKAKAAGFFKSAAVMEGMRKDGDLDAVRGRRDFQELFPMPRPKGQTNGIP